MNKNFKEIKEIIFKQLKRKLASVGIRKIDHFKKNYDLLNNEIYDSLDYMNIAVALEDRNIELDLSLNRNRFPRSLNDFFLALFDKIKSFLEIIAFFDGKVDSKINMPAPNCDSFCKCEKCQDDGLPLIAEY